jgi:hypothetical protein
MYPDNGSGGQRQARTGFSDRRILRQALDIPGKSASLPKPAAPGSAELVRAVRTHGRDAPLKVDADRESVSVVQPGRTGCGTSTGPPRRIEATRIR